MEAGTQVAFGMEMEAVENNERNEDWHADAAGGRRGDVDVDEEDGDNGDAEASE